MVQLGRYITENWSRYSSTYECVLCDRTFTSLQAVESHCRYTSAHEWCERCERVFRSSEHKQDHLNKSTVHNVCTWCPLRPDYSEWSRLLQHRELFHNWCDRCGDTFSNNNNLRMHKRRHEDANLECYGFDCYRTFASFSRMLIHLESGSCASGTDLRTINTLVAEYENDDDECTVWKDGCMVYYCPDCSKEFRFFSGLSQHVETTDCSSQAEWPNVLCRLQEYISRQL